MCIDYRLRYMYFAIKKITLTLYATMVTVIFFKLIKAFFWSDIFHTNTCNLTLKKYRCNFISLLIFIENGHYTSVSKLREAYSYKKNRKA